MDNIIDGPPNILIVKIESLPKTGEDLKSSYFRKPHDNWDDHYDSDGDSIPDLISDEE